MNKNHTIGIDLGEEGGDKTVIVHAKMNGHGITKVWFDESANLPDYKWYRNPIKWWQWRKLNKLIERQMKRIKK